MIVELTSSDAEFDNAEDGAAPKHSDESRSPRDWRSQGTLTLCVCAEETAEKFQIASVGVPFFELATPG